MNSLHRRDFPGKIAGICLAAGILPEFITRRNPDVAPSLNKLLMKKLLIKLRAITSLKKQLE